MNTTQENYISYAVIILAVSFSIFHLWYSLLRHSFKYSKSKNIRLFDDYSHYIKKMKEKYGYIKNKRDAGILLYNQIYGSIDDMEIKLNDDNFKDKIKEYSIIYYKLYNNLDKFEKLKKSNTLNIKDLEAKYGYYKDDKFKTNIAKSNIENIIKETYDS